MSNIIAVTGHRPDKLGGYGIDGMMRRGRLALKVLEQEKPDTVLTGMAVGWDQAIASACIVLGIEYIACIPFVGQEKMWPVESQNSYAQLLACAYDIIIVSPGIFTAKKMQVRNQFMVDRCNKLVALWDGSDGGTANCVRYAAKKHVPVVNVFNQFK